jgi:hypothetical protein
MFLDDTEMGVDQGRRRVCPGQGITLEIFAKVRVAGSNPVARWDRKPWSEALFAGS